MPEPSRSPIQQELAAIDRQLGIGGATPPKIRDLDQSR
jgi:hypothetical protein